MAQTLIRPQEVINGGIVRPAPLNARFDAMLLAPQIFVAEQRYIMPILCLDFYEALIAAQNAANCNYNPDLGALVDKFPNDTLYETLWVESGLYELVARAVFIVSLPYIAIQTGSNGIYQVNADYATNAGDKQLKFLIDREAENIKVLQDRVQDWLCRNKVDYPLYPSDKRCEDVSGCEDCEGSEQFKYKNAMQKIGLY